MQTDGLALCRKSCRPAGAAQRAAEQGRAERRL